MTKASRQYWLSREAGHVSLGRYRAPGALVALLALAAMLPAQGPPLPAGPPAQEAPPLRITTTVERVNVDVAVTDAHGNFVSGLARSQFHVFDDGVEQPITNFSPVEDPVRLLLLVETGPAVYMLSEEHVLAAYRLLDGLAPADAVALASYDDRIHGTVDFTTDKSLIATALNRMQFSLGMARLDLFGSLAEAMEILAPAAAVSEGSNPAPPVGAAASSSAASGAAASEAAGLPMGRVAIVLLSTGLSDVREPAMRASLHDRLLTSGVAAYVVALGGALRAPAKKASARRQASNDAGGPSPSEAAAAFAQADRDLKDLAESSGGRAYFPRTAKDLDGAYREIAATLRHLYSLAFVPPAHDQKIHTLRVEVRDAAGRTLAPRAGHEGWALLARPAYRAP